jgi:DNA ligase D-like protein (predicted polymerase)
VLKRHPDGAQTEAIYQKRVPEHRPDWLQTAVVTFPSGRHAAELCVVDVAHVAWAANLGTLDFHPWPSRRPDTEHPDELRIDLDPQPGTGYNDVVATALELRPVLAELGLIGWPKTSGSKGIHVYVRLEAGRYSFTDCRKAVLTIGRELERRRPELITTAWWREERGERVFVDYNRMARDQTIASAYSVRARPEATVSAPLHWDEVPDAHIGDFDITSMRQRFAELGDVHAGIDEAVCTLDAVLELAGRDERDRGLGEAPYPPNHPKMAGEPLRSRPSVATSAADKREAAAAKKAAKAAKRALLPPGQNRRQRGDPR